MLYPWRIWKWECIFRFASTKVLQSTQMLGLPFLLVMIMGREAWWRWWWRWHFIGDDNDDEEEDCIGDFGICENGSKFPGMPSPLRRSRVCCRSSSQITSHQFSQRCEYSSPSAQYVIHLCTWFSPPGSLHLHLTFSRSIPLQVAVEESCIYTCTPDWNPVIDTVPGSHNVVFAVGFSGDNLIFLKATLLF